MPGDSETAPAGSAAKVGFTLSKHPQIDAIADEWDRLVPRDLPHFRAGYLRACEVGEVMKSPEYFLVRDQDQPVAAALAYTVVLDTTMSASPGKRKWVDFVRKIYPGFLWQKMRICGPPVSNGECGFCFDSKLSPDDRKQVLRQVIPEVEASAGKQQTIFVKEFTDQRRDEYAAELEKMGFFGRDPGPSTSMEIRWESFDDYLAALKKRYRRRIRTDLKAAQELEIEWLDSFADLAPRAYALYDNVVSRAEYSLEKGTEEFFRRVSDFDQASLLVARYRPTSEIVGVNLLLFGDTCMHNLYIGFDYETNQKCSTYFNLVEESLRIAIERNCRICYFGPASYEFKTRIGATTFPLTAYMKHPVRFVHRMLEKSELWPEEEIPSHDVFQGAPDGQQ